MADFKFLSIVMAVIAFTLITAQDQHNHNSGPPRDGPNGGRRPPPFNPNSDPEESRISGNKAAIYKEIIRCNYTSLPGASCLSCTQSLICSRLNYGILTTCNGRRPYCNGGTCYKNPMEYCGPDYE